LGGCSYNSAQIYPVFPLLQLPGGTDRNLSQPLPIVPETWLGLFSYFPRLSKSRPTTEMSESSETDLSSTPSEWEPGALSDVIGRSAIELTPEFFGMPDAFPDGLKLVYNMRKKLESAAVQKDLHLWIDLVFGVQSSAPYRIFKNPHPPRGQTSGAGRIGHCIQFDIVYGLISFVTITPHVNGQLAMYSIVNNSILRKTILSISEVVRVKTVWQKEISPERSVICSIADGLLFIDSENCQLNFVSQTEEFSLEQDLFPTEFAGENSVCFSRSGVVFCVKKSGPKIETFGVCQIYPEFPVCVASSPRYSVTAVGVASGRIYLFNRVTGKYLWAIGNAGDCPKRILLTSAFPMLIVQYAKSLRVYSISGELVRELDRSFDISCWCSCVSETGFDYVFLSDMIGRVFAVEVFNLAVREFFRCSVRILMMTYSSTVGGIIAFTQEGKGVYHPYDLE
jgi:hypothetical protein